MTDYLTLCRSVYRGMLDDGLDPHDDDFLRKFSQRLRLFGGTTRLVRQAALDGTWFTMEVFVKSFGPFVAGDVVPEKWLQ